MNLSTKHLHTNSSHSLGFVARQSELEVRLLELGGHPIDEEGVDELQQVLHVSRVVELYQCQDDDIPQKETSLPSDLFISSEDDISHQIQQLKYIQLFTIQLISLSPV